MGGRPRATKLNNRYSFLLKSSGLPKQKRGSVWLYGLIGLTGVALDLVVFWVLVEINIIPVIATGFSSLLGIANNYLWNAILNFRRPLSARAFTRYATVGVGGLFASATLLSVFMLFGFSPLSAKISSMPMILLAQYWINKQWTFMGRHS